MKDKTILILPYIGAVILGMSFVNNSFSIFSLLGFLPIIYYLYELKNKHFGWGYLNLFCSLFLFESIVLGWMLSTSPASWLPMSSSQSILSVLLVWIFTTSLMSSGFILFVLACKKLNSIKNISLLSWSFLISIFWVFSEIIRSYITSVGVSGMGSIYGVHWNFGSLGYTAIDSPLDTSSRIIGLFGLSFLVIIFNFVIFFLINKKLNYAIFFALIVVIFVVTGQLLYANTGMEEIKVSSIHFGAQKVDDKETIPLEDFKDSINENYDSKIIVFPEHSNLYKSRDVLIEATEHLSKDGKIIAGDRLSETYPSLNYLTYYNKDAELTDAYPKWFIVPYGEYVPYIVEKLFTLFKFDDVLNSFEHNRRIIPGSKPTQNGIAENIQIGGQVCSGITSPNIYHNATKNGAQILTNSAGLSIFAGNKQYHDQAEQMAKYHAISNSRSFIQSTKSGQSLIMDSSGNIISETNKREGIESIHGYVRTNDKLTPAAILGIWSMFLVIIPLGVIVVAHQKLSNNKT